MSIPRKISEIQKKLEGMSDEIDRHFTIETAKKKDPHGHVTSRRPHSSSLIDEWTVIGRDENKRKIVDMLLWIEGVNVSVIPIVGMGGIGKTTLTTCL